jgi:hypothetical protein
MDKKIWLKNKQLTERTCANWLLISCFGQCLNGDWRRWINLLNQKFSTRKKNPSSHTSTLIFLVRVYRQFLFSSYFVRFYFYI